MFDLEKSSNYHKSNILHRRLSKLYLVECLNGPGYSVLDMPKLKRFGQEYSRALLQSNMFLSSFLYVAVKKEYIQISEKIEMCKCSNFHQNSKTNIFLGAKRVKMPNLDVLNSYELLQFF